MNTNIEVGNGFGKRLRINHVRSVMETIGFTFSGTTRTKTGTILSFTGAKGLCKQGRIDLAELFQEFLNG